LVIRVAVEVIAAVVVVVVVAVLARIAIHVTVCLVHMVGVQVVAIGLSVHSV
jgi:hypothetical protein